MGAPAQDAVSLKSGLALGVPYGLFLSAVYLLAYWGPLGLMPFQYANVADLSSATLAGLTITFIGLALGVVGGLAIGRLAPQPPPKFAKDLFIILMASSAIAIPVLWIVLKTPAKWFLIGMFASFLATPLLMMIPALSRLLGNDYIRPLLTMAIAYMPAFMYGYGTLAVSKVQSAHAGMQIDLARSEIGAISAKQLKYAGLLGDFHVAYELQTRSTVLIPAGTRITLTPPQLEPTTVRVAPAAKN